MLKDFRREKELLHWIRFGVWDADNDQQMEKRIQQLLEEGVDINYIDGVTDCTDDDLPSYMSCYGGESKVSSSTLARIIIIYKKIKFYIGICANVKMLKFVLLY